MHDKETCPWCINVRLPPELGGGWWGDRTITHCSTCGATWRRTSRIGECTQCHLLFGGTAGFDQHITKGGVHVHPKDVGLIESTNEWGFAVWRREVEFRTKKVEP